MRTTGRGAWGVAVAGGLLALAPGLRAADGAWGVAPSDHGAPAHVTGPDPLRAPDRPAGPPSMPQVLPTPPLPVPMPRRQPATPPPVPLPHARSAPESPLAQLEDLRHRQVPGPAVGPGR